MKKIISILFLGLLIFIGIVGVYVDINESNKKSLSMPTLIMNDSCNGGALPSVCMSQFNLNHSRKNSLPTISLK